MGPDFPAHGNMNPVEWELDFGAGFWTPGDGKRGKGRRMLLATSSYKL